VFKEDIMPRINRLVYLNEDAVAKRSQKLKKRTGEYVHDKIKPIRVQWHEMSKSGIARHIGKRGIQLAAVAGIIYASNPNGPFDIWGDPETAVSIEDQRAEAEFIARDTYNMQSVEGKFTLQYISVNEGEISGADLGNGLLGFISSGGNQELVYRFGQTCLAGSAYDVTPSSVRGGASGDVSAVAALNYSSEDGYIKVYPANSDAEPLVFTMPPNNGLLYPDATTMDTLNAYGCEPEGLVVEEEIGSYPKYWVPIQEK
jgi:hypothetical protein